MSKSNETSPLLGESRSSYQTSPSAGDIMHTSLNVGTNPHAVRRRRQFSYVTELTQWEYNLTEGRVYHMSDVGDSKGDSINENEGHHSTLLSEIPATAICANDITSSCLYVVGLVCADAGIYAPICCLLAVSVLYLYKGIYTEVVGALPLNGGTFNVLLHTTSKRTAAFASILAILSYVATGVVSGTSAVHYLHLVMDEIPLMYGTLALLGFFAILNLIGINESANFAILLFAFHVLTLSCLISCTAYFIFMNGMDQFWDNVAAQTTSFSSALFYGFSSAMLGVSGFESSSQYVQEQQPGVFPKTLRNMWLSVTIINPVLSFLAICTLDIGIIAGDPSMRATVLANMASKTGGHWLYMMVSVDAFTVLAGAVLTAFVGSTGLLRRLASDGCLPQFLLNQNKLRGTNHTIIISFFLVCSSMFLLLQGDVDVLSEVYSICFMGLMIFFAVGSWLMKWKRKSLLLSVKDEERVSWIQALIAPVFIVIAFISTVMKNKTILNVFALYFSFTAIFVFTMIFRFQSLRMLYYALNAINIQYDHMISYFTRRNKKLYDSNDQLHLQTQSMVGSWATGISEISNELKHSPCVFFASKPRAEMLNKAILYVRENEVCDWVRFVHFYGYARGTNEEIVDESVIPNSLLQKLEGKCNCFLREQPERKVGKMDHAISCQIHYPPVMSPSLDDLFGEILEEKDLRIQILSSFKPENTPTKLELERIIMLIDQLRILDQCYPKLCLDLVLIHSPFSPTSVNSLSNRLQVPINRMFMACPENRFLAHIRNVGSYGGIRVITH